MKKLIIGLVVGLMLGLSTNAIAAIGDKVEAIFSKFNYVVDGVDKELDSPVLVYEGTSYVRTTQIANLLGFDVTYKANSRTIEFKNPDINKPLPTSTVEEILTQTPGTTTEPIPTPLPTNVVSIATPTPAPIIDIVTTATPTPSPVPTPDPKIAMCKILRDKQALDFYAYEQTLSPFSGSSQFKKDQFKAQQALDLSAAGC